MENKMMKEMCPNQKSDIAQQKLPGRLIGRAREFESRGAGSNPAPATEGAIAFWQWWFTDYKEGSGFPDRYRNPHFN